MLLNTDTSIMFSSKTDNWETPQYLFKELDNEFHFTLDPAADDRNHKCKLYCTKENDGLLFDWTGHRVFCNPPYGRNLGRWIKKAYDTQQESGGGIIVMLIPARTDTRWFHDYIYKKSGVEVRFLKGRLRFGNSVHNAPFPSDRYMEINT